VPYPDHYGHFISKETKQEMKNRSLIEAAVQVILDIVITGIGTRVILGIQARKDLGLIALSILISLVNQNNGVEHKGYQNIHPALIQSQFQYGVFGYEVRKNYVAKLLFNLFHA
jgi:hypothetical protein